MKFEFRGDELIYTEYIKLFPEFLIKIRKMFI